jgi:hypothetical protein
VDGPNPQKAAVNGEQEQPRGKKQHQQDIQDIMMEVPQEVILSRNEENDVDEN